MFGNSNEAHLFVDKVQTAAMWEVDVVGFESPREVNRGMLEAACLNEARREKQKQSAAGGVLPNRQLANERGSPRLAAMNWSH
jgi:hypothetical protein